MASTLPLRSFDGRGNGGLSATGKGRNSFAQQREDDDEDESPNSTPGLLPSASTHTLTEPPKGRTLSCSECKRRKIKCDRAHPCGPCILRNDQARCKPVIRWEAGCSLSEFTILQNKVKELERRLDGIQGRSFTSQAHGDDIAASTVAALRSPKASSSQQSPAVKATVAPSSTFETSAHTRESGNGEDDAVMMLEDFAMGNRANARRAAQNLVPRSLHAMQGEALDEEGGLRLETAANQRSADSAMDVAYRFLRLAPGADLQRVMIDYYFDRLEWYSKCLYRPAYMKDFEHLLSLDIELAAQRVRPTFLCTHFMVICLVIHLCTSEEVHQWGFSRQGAISMCDALFAGSQQLLWASDFIGSHQLEHLQAVVLMSIYAYNVDEQADAAYALAGASIKIAQNLALNRLDDARFLEHERKKGRQQSNAQQSYQSQSPLEREMGKRVWWKLIWLDWSHSLSHGGCYTIHPAHNRTNLPANVSDDDLTAHAQLKQLVISRPMDEYTSMSFTIWRLRFLMVYRETIDILNTPTGMTHAQLMDMDKKLMDLLTGLPPYFQLAMDEQDRWTTGDSCYEMERLSINITGWNRILRLHRPFLARALYDRGNLSRKRCVDAAFNILALFRHAKKHAPLLLKIWIHIYYVFSGALVLFLDLCYDNDGNTGDAEAKRKAIREMLDICDTARHLSAAAKNTHQLLFGLLEAEMELRVHQSEGQANGGGEKSSSKRKRGKSNVENAGSSSPFVSLVERVLTDAAARTGSGDSVTSSALGRSPNSGDYGRGSIASGIGSALEPRAKHHRHSTSFVRDRNATISNDGRLYDPRKSMSGTGAGASGHGGYFAGAMDTTASAGMHGTPHNGPLSPWSTSHARATPQTNGPWASSGPGYSSPAYSGVGTSGSMIGSPAGGPYSKDGGTSMTSVRSNSNAGGGGGGNSNMPGHGVPFSNNGNFASGTSGAATTSGLSNLLDEDIFSLLSGSHFQNHADWEDALALVAPLPTPVGANRHDSVGGP